VILVALIRVSAAANRRWLRAVVSGVTSILTGAVKRKKIRLCKSSLLFLAALSRFSIVQEEIVRTSKKLLTLKKGGEPKGWVATQGSALIHL
jgi:hypothetical protein